MENKDINLGVFTNKEGHKIVVVAGTDETVKLVDMDMIYKEFGPNTQVISVLEAISRGMIQMPLPPSPVKLMSGKERRRERRQLLRKKPKTKNEKNA